MADRAPREDFLRDVADHQMTVVHDSGLHRHLTFRRPGTGNMHFHITTWPGYLAISGDMNAYIFSRMPDMFDFHRVDPGRDPSFSYWAEKVRAVDKNSGIYVYDEDAFHVAVRDDLREMAFPDFATARAVVSQVKDDLLDVGFSSREEAITAAVLFAFHTDDRTYRFEDFYDHSLTTYSHGFVWACRAVAWGVRRYDLHKAGNTQAAHDADVLRGRK